MLKINQSEHGSFWLVETTEPKERSLIISVHPDGYVRFDSQHPKLKFLYSRKNRLSMYCDWFIDFKSAKELLSLHSSGIVDICLFFR